MNALGTNQFVRWTPEEDAHVREHYPAGDVAAIALALGRTEDSIRQRARHLRLRREVRPGGANCYAETQSRRNPGVLGEWGPGGKRVIASEAYWRQPLRWDREAARAGERWRVFCASLADVFEERPELVEPRRRLFRL